ncbi:MAG: ABC transporter ATP-binding protein/permease [Bacillota bacterium]|nr:ABC transporter ATP-binding protein/permease [Bacillota bacterium]
MISLKNVSKFYYKKGIIATGMTKVNLHFDLGEFVVITGESGSGKSTLLNVISGMDTYEEGEMYIRGRETSHFTEKDFVEYRKKYIGNIFQSFNLVNSYTVYQNVELVLLINGFKKSQIKSRVNDILGKVGLKDFARSKVSKLSGGQKQRVAIARALAKETDIIVADEPTGNLDSKSAAEIVKLLSEIAQDKLVIVVTHNYEQFKDYATRRIKMHDGKIVENVQLKKTDELVLEEAPDEKTNRAGEVGLRQKSRTDSRRNNGSGSMSAFNKLRLGIRNTFNVIPKFVLLFIVFAFMLVAVTSEYTSYLSQKETAENLGYNSYFTNLRPDRVVLKKDDKSKFTADDFATISEVDNVAEISEYDVLLDKEIYLESGDFYYTARARSVTEFSGKLIGGRMPSKPNEIILTANEDNYYFSKKYQKKLIDRVFKIDLGSGGDYAKVKVTGIAYSKSDYEFTNCCDMYMSDKMLNGILTETYHDSSKIAVDINGKVQTVETGDVVYNLKPNKHVSPGNAVVSNEFDNFYNNGQCKGKEIKVTVSNIYYKSAKKFKISEKYSEKNFKRITGISDYDMNGGLIFINPADYNRLFTNDNYQVTVLVKDKDKVNETKKALANVGYDPLPLRDVIVQNISNLLQLIMLPVMIIILLALFFISYFVIKLILRTRTGYFSILKMLGLNEKSIKRIMDIELITIMLIAYGVFIGAAVLTSMGYISVKFINDMVKYMNYENYAILLAVLVAMSYLISGKFSRSLFKRSSLGTFREEE